MNKQYIYTFLFTSLVLFLASCSNREIKKDIFSMEIPVNSSGEVILDSLNTFYSNGNPKARSELKFFNKKATGKYYTYYESGKPRSIRMYSNGKLDGKSLEFTEKAPVKQETYYKEGKFIKCYLIDTLNEMIFAEYENYIRKSYFDNSKFELLMNDKDSSITHIIRFSAEGHIIQLDGDPLSSFSKEDLDKLDKDYPNWRIEAKHFIPKP